MSQPRTSELYDMDRMLRSTEDPEIPEQLQRIWLDHLLDAELRGEDG